MKKTKFQVLIPIPPSISKVTSPHLQFTSLFRRLTRIYLPQLTSFVCVHNPSPRQPPSLRSHIKILLVKINHSISQLTWITFPVIWLRRTERSLLAMTSRYPWRWPSTREILVRHHPKVLFTIWSTWISTQTTRITMTTVTATSQMSITTRTRILSTYERSTTKY